MGNLPLFLGLGLFLTIFGVAASAPPIYEVHDYVSMELQKRRTIKANKKCDADFGGQLESIVEEIEKSKDATEEVAMKMKKSFIEYLEKRPEGRLCSPGTWCEGGICKKRQVGRAMEKQANDETKPSPVPRQAAGDDTAMSSSSKPDEEADDDKDSDDDEKKKDTDTSGSAALQAIQPLTRWMVMGFIAFLLPYNL